MKNNQVWVDAGIYKFYINLLDEQQAEFFVNRFGKLDVLPDVEVYVKPVKNAIGWPYDGAEVKILKMK